MNTRKNLILGAFLLSSIGVLTVLSLYLYGVSVGPRTTWVAYFGEDSIVEAGYDVWTGGIRIGVIDAVEPVPDAEFTKKRQVKATLLIKKGITVWNDGELVVRSRGFLGGYRAELRRGTPSAGERSATTPLPARIERDISQKLAEVVKENRDSVHGITTNLAKIIASIERGEGNIGSLIREDKLYRDFSKIADNWARFSETLNNEKSSFGKLLHDGALYDDAAHSFKAIRSILDKIDRGDGDLGALINDRTLVKRLADGIDEVRELVKDINSGKGPLGLLLKDQETADNLARAVKALRTFTENMNAGKGTLPALLNDPKIYEDIKIITSVLRTEAERIGRGEGNIGKLLQGDGIYTELQRMLESFRESGDIARENAALGSLTSFASLFFNTFN